MTDFKLEAQKIYNSLEDISHGKINYKEDLLLLIEIALQNEKLEILEKLTFHAKYSQGLIAIIQKQDIKIDDEYFEKIKIEFAGAIENVKNNINEILLFAGDFFKSIFTEKYFKMNQECIINLNNFCSDLSFLKLYMNDLKREGKK